MGPPQSSPNGERQAEQQQNEQSGQNGQNAQNGGSSQLVGAAAAAQQPKVVQTAFIHKLYKSVLDRSYCRVAATDDAAVCWKTKASNTSFLGQAPTRALSCHPRRNSPKFLRRYSGLLDIATIANVRLVNISNIPTFLLLFVNLICTDFTKVETPSVSLSQILRS